MNPRTLLVICGVAAVGYAVGRFTAPDNNNNVQAEYAATGGTAAGSAGGGDDASTTSRTRNAGGSQKAAPVKSATELRDEIKRLRNLSSAPIFDPLGMAMYGGGGSRDIRTMKEMAQIYDRLATSDVKALIQEYAQNPYTPRDAQGLQMLFSTMAGRDPEAAWRLAETLPKAMRNSALHTTVVFLAEKNPDSALAKLDSVKGTSQHRAMRNSIIGVIAKEDPQRGFALANAPSPDGQTRPEDQYVMGSVFANWARKDMKSAEAALEKLEGQARTSAVNSIANALAETDPAAAWKFATDNTPPSFNEFGGSGFGDGRWQILTQWAAQDPKAALEAAASEQNVNTRNSLLQASIRSWAATDYEAAYEHIMSSSDANVLAGGLAALAAMPESNRTEIFNTMLDRVPAEQLNRTMSSFLWQWSRDNPREAAAAIDQLPPGNTYSMAVQQLASQWFANATDKNEPLQWALSMNPGEARTNALSSMFRGWANADPAAAAAAAMELSGEERSRVMHSITSSWGQKDPQAALKWASSLTDASERKNTVNNTLGNIANSNPQQAITMLNSLDMGGDATAVGAIVNRWAGNDITAASDWVKKLPDGEVRDKALGSVAQKLAGDEPQSAIAWAQAIGDQSSRTSAIQSVVWTWKRHDPEAAKAWVSSSNLPEDVKSRLIGR